LITSEEGVEVMEEESRVVLNDTMTDRKTIKNGLKRSSALHARKRGRRGGLKGRAPTSRVNESKQN